MAAMDNIDIALCMTKYMLKIGDLGWPQLKKKNVLYYRRSKYMHLLEETVLSIDDITSLTHVSQAGVSVLHNWNTILLGLEIQILLQEIVFNINTCNLKDASSTAMQCVGLNALLDLENGKK